MITKFKHGSLFSGIGGFDLAAEWAGWDNVFHCEWNKFGQRILKFYWPKAISYYDITKTDFTIHRGTIDVLTGGFPCQPYSNAGEQKGTDDDRHLWPEMLRAIREIQPCYIVGENVPGLVSWSNGLVFEQVQADLEIEGYQVTPFLLPASGVNAPHQRERIWFIAYSNAVTQGLQSAEQKELPGANGHNERGAITELRKTHPFAKWPSQSPVCNRNDGISNRLVNITFRRWRAESLRAAGNAIVPNVALQIFNAIEEFELLSKLIV